MLHPKVSQIKPLVQAAIPHMPSQLRRVAEKIASADPSLAGRVWEAAEMAMSVCVTVPPGTPYPYEKARVREFNSRQWHILTLESQTWHCDCGAGRFCIHELATVCEDVCADENDEGEVVLGELIAALKDNIHRTLGKECTHSGALSIQRMTA